VSTIAIPMPFAPWCADYYKTMAATCSVANAVKRSASRLELVKHFWSADRLFRSLLRDLNSLQTIPKEEVPKLKVRLEELRSNVDKVLDLAGKRGLTNRTLINGSIQSLRASNENLQDFIERLCLSMDPKVLAEALEAIAEYERGEAVTLESVR